MEFTGERFLPGQGEAIELEHLNRYYFVVHQIDLTGKTVLDIASGEGYGSNILAKYAGNVIGVDISSEAIEQAKNKYKAENLEFIQGSVLKIPLQDKSVDVVVSFETIEHHDKHDEMMLEIKRILKNYGIVLISSPDKYYYSDLPGFKNKFHIKELYFEEFKELINKYFKKTIFFSQSAFTGSMIVMDGKKTKSGNPFLIDQEGNISNLTPVYNIAICSDNLHFSPQYQIIISKDTNKMITSSDLQDALRTGIQNGMKIVRNTSSYRLGRFLLKPFSLIRGKLYH